MQKLHSKVASKGDAQKRPQREGKNLTGVCPEEMYKSATMVFKYQETRPVEPQGEKTPKV